MAFPLLDTDWKTTPDSDGYWYCMDTNTLEISLLPIWAEAAHSDGFATVGGKEFPTHSDYKYAKVGDFPTGTVLPPPA